ncbi:GNAT family N-acetyltransferase [candidate division KSB1 bacterium]|nr:GNAT family N-acetyltransferase [candidate division KSB1 bacterium]MBL7093910.1 GNAT family N-acetyltransferase [candidate division KSB1 bacterium]
MNNIKYIQDSKVDETLNKKLIALLSICFLKDPVFQYRRYCKEMPQHRWYIEENNIIVAHLALHEKKINTENGEFPIGGVAEVCVHPDYRGKGSVKKMLVKTHNWLKENKFPFSMLFGEKEIYSSSGYSPVKNEIKYFDDKTEKWIIEINRHAMKNVLGSILWSEDLININGPMF